MNHVALATRYRPQTFSDVAGQPPAAIALSRAAKENRIAPAYLLSGTRGVGKTTVARIFAKALNCERGPGAEPCNTCAQCRHITIGNHIDVAEIDGASNTGVDDIRALRDTIGFMPMEGRYKIFIIDEAHMLSKSAFNALLKTLEEPPAHTVFIFATTEVHRFPATIVSRCQHFVFRHLSEPTIAAHLGKILKMENIPFEEDAVRLIARRAAGSVRDSLSLLDQVLAMGEAAVDSSLVRQTLGVAGPEMFSRLFKNMATQDCANILELTSELLGSGLDLAFFTRELITNLRNLFLLAQSGEKIIPALHLAKDEEQFLKAHASLFQPAHLHAAWQLAMENQRQLAQSPLPGAALELLLINLALLPHLLPVGHPDFQKIPIPEQEKPVSQPHPAAAMPDDPEPEPPLSWQGFREFCKTLSTAPPNNIIAAITASWQGNKLELGAQSEFLWGQLLSEKQNLENALRQYCGKRMPSIQYYQPPAPPLAKPHASRTSNKPELEMCCNILDAEISEYTEKTTGDKFHA